MDILEEYSDILAASFELELNKMKVFKVEVMMSKDIDEDDKKQVTSNESLKMARNNICENTLQLQAKGMERKLQNRLHILSGQASQLRQKIKVLNMEKQKADLEIKKRYFPRHDFQQDETQLQTSMRRLIIQCNQFYLNKKQRYPIRATYKEKRVNSASLPSCRRSSAENNGTVKLDSNKRSKSECSNRERRNQNMNSSAVSETKEQRFSNTSPDRCQTLPEILLRTEKEKQNLERFSVLLSRGKDSWEDSSAKFPAIQSRGSSNRQSSAQGSWLEDNDEEFVANLPNIDLKQIFSGTKVKSFKNVKPKTVPSYCASQQSSQRGCRFDKSQVQNHLEFETMRVKWKINNYLLQDKRAANGKRTETSKPGCSEDIDNPSSSLSEESFKLYREREAMNTVPRDVNKIRQDHNWRLTTPIEKSESFIDNLTVIMTAGMPGMSCHNVSFLPLNSARRALRHTPTFKMQQFLRRMMAQSSQAQQFEVIKLQTELEATTVADAERKPPDRQTDSQPVQAGGDVSKGLEPEISEISVENVKTIESDESKPLHTPVPEES